MARTPELRRASIMPQVIRYHLTTVALALLCTVVGIVLLPVVLPLLYLILTRYYSRLQVILTRRDLLVHRGIFEREEKSIPLEKITDLAVYQGPVMRYFGIKGIRVETAGQSAGGALVMVLGIEDIDDFRDQVLSQRDRVSEREAAEPAAATHSAPSDGNQLAVLSDIRDSLRRIEAHLASR